ncbi:MAG TPA: hypothetical protein PLS69_11760, partial [Terricaulis sp.]|nr:hypothetical protein [Terricaulis sp.]
SPCSAAAPMALSAAKARRVSMTSSPAGADAPSQGRCADPGDQTRRSCLRGGLFVANHDFTSLA